MKLNKTEKWALVLTALFLAAVLSVHLLDSGEKNEPVLTEYIAAATPMAKPESESEEKININTASAEALEQLDGIGPVLAGRIIDYRESNGPFGRIEDIAFVPGIASDTYEKIRDHITVE